MDLKDIDGGKSCTNPALDLKLIEKYIFSDIHKRQP